MRAIRILLVAAVLTAGCQPIPPPKRAAPEPAPTAPSLIRGHTFFLERMLLAPGATLDVLLIGEPAGDAASTPGAPTIVAQAQFADLHGPPYDFDLPFDPARIEAGRHYSLRAALRDAAGHLEFATDARVPVTPGDAQRVDFRLVRVGGS